MKTLLIVGLGSALGGMARYLTLGWAERRFAGEFPWGVLIANVLGSLLIGALLPLYLKQGWGKEDFYPLLLSFGFLGGYTTFSTFSLQTLKLLQNEQFGLAALNAGASVVACLVAVFAGWKIGAAIWG